MPSSQRFLTPRRDPPIFRDEVAGLPFVVGVLADLSGVSREQLADVGDREFIEFDLDNFSERMKAVKPRVAFEIPNILTGEGSLKLDLIFESMDDFSPMAVTRKVSWLHELLYRRQGLTRLNFYFGTKDMEMPPTNLLPSSWLVDLDPPGITAPARADVSEFERLLNKTPPPAPSMVSIAIGSFQQKAGWRHGCLPVDPGKAIAGIVAEIDRWLANLINLILHHDDFKAVEGVWRGLYYLVNNTATSSLLKIRVLNISKTKLGETTEEHRELAWNQNPLFRKIYHDESGSPEYVPYGMLIGDYYFNHSARDVEILESIAQVASIAHCPFITGASPALMDMESWKELIDRPELAQIFSSPEHAVWRGLRDSETSRYLALAMPRFLSRTPWSIKSPRVDDFVFEEDTGRGDHSKHVWANSAYAMGVNVTRAFQLYGWCARIRGLEAGGIVEGLPASTFATDDRGIDITSTTEVAIDSPLDSVLDRVGLMTLLFCPSIGGALFLTAPTLHRPVIYDQPEACIASQLAACLPYVFATSRFAHFLGFIARKEIKSFKDRHDMERRLNGWIKSCCTGNGKPSDREKAERPLAMGEVVIGEVDGHPEYYVAKVLLLPDYQLEGLKIALRLSVRLPSLISG